MIRNDLRELLIQQKEQLHKEIVAIDALLTIIDENVPNLGGNTYKSQLESIDEVKEPIESKFNSETVVDSDEVKIVGKIPAIKSTEIWKDYILKVLKLIGGNEVKSKTVAENVLKANPKFTEKRIRQVTIDKLSELAKENKVAVIKGKTRKEGNRFTALD